MFQNYLKIALRNLMRHKGYSLINVLGLSVGVACCVLIGLFIHDEFRVDRFHKKSDRIYKLLREMRNDDGTRDMGFGTSGAAGPALKKDYSEIETVVRYMPDYSWTTYKDRKFNQRFCLTDPNFVDYGISSHSDITYVYLFAIIGLFILLIACINFMNLSTARSARRAREVGLRKVVGAYRAQLIRQFLGETFLTALLAGLLSLIIVKISLPLLNNFAQKTIALEGQTLWYAIAGLFVLTVLVSLLSGGYPALFLSSFRPVTVLKGTLVSGTRSGRLRQILVVFQFAISTFLIAGTYTVYQQLNYVQNKNLGFDKDLMVLTWLFATDRRLTDDYLNIKNEFLKHPNILKASAGHSTMGYGGQLDRVFPEGRGGEDWRMRVLGVDEAFLDTYNLELVSGRNFSLSVTTDTSQAFILNETAVKRLGWTEPIGKAFGWAAGNREKGVVIGVVKDFHNRSLHEIIRPVAIAMWQPKFNVLSLKIRGQDIDETLKYIGEIWRKYIPEKPFYYRFLDENLARYYLAEQRMGHE